MEMTLLQCAYHRDPCINVADAAMGSIGRSSGETDMESAGGGKEGGRRRRKEGKGTLMGGRKEN